MNGRLRGFFFTALFLGMFLALLGFAVFYKASAQAWSLTVSEKKIGTKIADVADNVAWDLRKLLQLDELAVERNGPVTTVRLSAKMPSIAGDPAAALASYASFLNGPYSQRTGANTTLDPASLSAPSVYFDYLGFNVSWANLSKTSMLAYAPALEAIDSQGKLSANCNGTGGPRCSFSSASWSWVSCGAGTLNVSLRIADHGGSTVSINGASSGCVTASQANEFTMIGAGGNMTVSAGTVAGVSPAFGLSLTGALGYDSALSANFSSTGPVRARIPAALTINNRSVGSLVLAED